MTQALSPRQGIQLYHGVGGRHPESRIHSECTGIEQEIKAMRSCGRGAKPSTGLALFFVLFVFQQSQGQF